MMPLIGIMQRKRRIRSAKKEHAGSVRSQGAVFAQALSIFLAVMLISMNLAFARSGKKDGGEVDWTAYAADAAGTHYSPLREINRDSVKNLKIAWTYHTGADKVMASGAHKAAFEATPLMIDGTLYLTTPYDKVIALDPETGTEKWTYDPKVNVLTQDYSEITSRGVSAWADSRLKPGSPEHRRIYVGTIDARLIALDAASGQPCRDFGQDGQVDLSRGVRLTGKGNYQVTSPPAIIGDLVVVGSSIGDNRGVELERGIVRAYDARTGKLVWGFDPIPTDPSDPARKTWKGDGAIKTGAANVWSPISADPKRGLVFVSTTSPSPDFYGGERLGDDVYANSVVALRASTGKVVWYFQAVHHDLWDYDVPCEPVLVDVRWKGKSVPAVAVGTKMGHVFVLDRETGKPVFPVEERPVPQTDVPGEETSPTQPFPALTPPLVPQGLTADQAWGLTPADREACKQKIESLRSDGMFTPPSLKGTLAFPGNVGGINWGGLTYDPVRQLLFAATNRLPFVVKLIPRDEFTKMMSQGVDNRMKGEFARQTGTPYAMYREPLLSPIGAPCNPPPWGALVAVDLTTGKIKWESPLGMIPALSVFKGSSEWGSINLGGSMVTAGGLVFAAAGMDAHIRGFDVDTGKEVWKAELPTAAQSTPMTYRAKNRKQYLV
ncbi:MAG: pyrroloquinoline quinone-dependent dehydrogenase, partial [Blastocatellia bacterium]